MTTERTVVWTEFWFQVGHFLFESNDIWMWYFPGYKHDSVTKQIIINVNNLSEQCWQTLNANWIRSKAEQLVLKD